MEYYIENVTLGQYGEPTVIHECYLDKNEAIKSYMKKCWGEEKSTGNYYIYEVGTKIELIGSHIYNLNLEKIVGEAETRNSLKLHIKLRGMKCLAKVNA